MVRKLLMAIGVTVVLLFLVLYSGMADPLLIPARDYALQRIVQMVSKSLNGSLEVGALRGSLFRSPVLHDIVLRDAQGTVIGQIEELRLAYDLTSLLRWRLTIREIVIVRPHLTVVEGPDGTLNVNHLLPPAPQEARTPEEPSAGFGLPIAVALERFQILDGRIDLRLPALPTVRTVDGLQVHLSGQADREGLRLQLRQFTAHTSPADVTLQTMQGAVQVLAGVTQIDKFRLQLGHLSLTADGVLPGAPQPANFNLQLQAPDLTEIGRLLGNDMLHGRLHLALKAEGPPDALDMSAQITTAGGSIDVQGHIDTVATPIRYRATLDVTKLDLTALLRQATLQSDLNLHLGVEGEGVSPQELRSVVQVEIQPSHLGDIALHASQIDLEAAEQRFQVRRFDIDTSVARMTASGAIDLAGTSDLHYELAADFADLRQLLGTAELSGTLKGQGQASGQWPALHGRGTLTGQQIQYEGNHVGSLQLTYDASQLGSTPSLAAQLLVREVRVGSLPVEQVDLEATYHAAERQARFAVEARQSSTEGARLHGRLTLSDTGQQVVVEELQVRLPDRTWQASAPLEVTIEGQRIAIGRFHLAHANEFIEVSGGIDGERLQDIRVHVAQIDLSYLRRLLDLPDLVGGGATLQVQLTGTMADPMLQADLSVHADVPQRPLFEQLHTTLNYQAHQLRSTMHLQQAQRQVLEVDVHLPIDMAFTALPLEQRLRDGPIELQLDLKQPNLAALHRLQPALPKLAGTVQGTLGLQGTYASLALHSNLQLQHLGLEGAAEQVDGRLSLTGKLLTADSVQELRQAMAQGKLTPQVQDLTLRLPALQGRIPDAEKGPQPFEVRDLLVEANGQLSPDGLEATLRTLRLQARGFGLPPTDVKLTARLTPQQVELSSLHVRLPQSEIRGQGHLSLPGQQMQFRLDIPRLQLDEFPVTLPADLPKTMQGTITAQGSLQAPQVEARIRYAGAQIFADLAAQLQERLPGYQATLRIENLDIAQFLPQEKGQVHVRLRLEGSGFAEAERRVTLDVNVDSTALSLMPGLSTRLHGNLAGNTLQLETFRVRSTPLEMTASGTLSAAKQSALTYKLTLGDLRPLHNVLGAELQASGSLSGELRGPLDALQARGALRIDKWRYADLHGQRLQADFSASQIPSAPQATFKAQISDVEAPSLPATSVRIESNFAAPQGSFTVTVTGGPYQKTAIAGHVVLAEGQRLTLQRLRLQSKDLVWENDAPMVVVRSAQGTLQMQALRLRSGSQAISVQGTLAPDGPVQAEVHVQRLQIGPTIRMVAPNAAVPQGQINLDLNLNGTLQQPRAQGQLQVSSLTWEKQQLGEMRAEINVADMILRTDLRWQNQARELLRVNGTLGLSADGALAMQVRTPDLDLAILNPISQAIMHSAGRLHLDLQLTGTLRQPQAHGFLELRDGELQLQATGERYREMQARVLFAGERLTIERMHVGSRSGPLQLTGWIETAGTTLRQLDLSLQAKDFTAMRTAMIEAIISSDLSVRGSLDDMKATGTVTVPRARVTVKDLPTGGVKEVQPWQLTVPGVYGPGPQAVMASHGDATRLARDEAPLPFLQADLRLDLPRNVWIHAPGTAIELSGDIHVTKARHQPFMLSGSASTVRGFASLYGKKFVLEEGHIIFTGSSEINPQLDVKVTHQVSNYQVMAAVAGRALTPKITLSSTPELPQADIVSLLVIGKTTERLTSTERNSLSSQVGQFAGDFVAGQLEGIVGESLGLDTVGVTAGEGLGLGSVSVGRYITQDIFLTYEREFSGHGGNKVGVEYSINPNLKLKGSSSDTGGSAVDFLWRKEY